jgi:mono/diheme cytochrome c family protein
MVVGLLLLLSTRAGAEEEETDIGRKMYLQYCSACHGSQAKGDGVVSHLMQSKPPDLTQLARKNGGKFPFYEMIRVIDGRETHRAHGDPEMPVWGALFAAGEGDAPDAQIVARGKVVMIADYLERIQQK